MTNLPLFADELSHRLRTVQTIFTNEIEYIRLSSEADTSLLSAANERLSLEIAQLHGLAQQYNFELGSELGDADV
jgi:hypothetical protein